MINIIEEVMYVFGFTIDGVDCFETYLLDEIYKGIFNVLLLFV